MILALAKTKWVFFLIFLLYFHIGEKSKMTYPCSELRDAAEWITESLLQVWVGDYSPVSAVALNLYLWIYSHLGMTSTVLL